MPNFSYAELLKMVQYILVRQRILESGTLKSKKERDSACGYIYNHETDMRTTTSIMPKPANLTPKQLDGFVELGQQESSKIFSSYLFPASVLCDQLYYAPSTLSTLPCLARGRKSQAQVTIWRTLMWSMRVTTTTSG